MSRMIFNFSLAVHPVTAYLALLQDKLDTLLLAENAPEYEPKRAGFPVWAIVLIGVAVVLCLLPICTIAILTLLGPSIGNVFSEVIESL
jgi:hypothetical protein